MNNNNISKMKQCIGCLKYQSHRVPLPLHYTIDDVQYCCSKCKLSNGKEHGGQCEQILFSHTSHSSSSSEVIELETQTSLPSTGFKQEEIQNESIKCFDIKSMTGFEKYETNLIVSDQGHDSSKKATCFHQAGYDAYCTGLIFLKLVEAWDQSTSSTTSSSTSNNNNDNDNDNSNSNNIYKSNQILSFTNLISPYLKSNNCDSDVQTDRVMPLNKLNLMRSPYVLQLDSFLTKQKGNEKGNEDSGGEDPCTFGERAKNEVLKRKNSKMMLQNKKDNEKIQQQTTNYPLINNNNNNNNENDENHCNKKVKYSDDVKNTSTSVSGATTTSSSIAQWFRSFISGTTS